MFLIYFLLLTNAFLIFFLWLFIRKRMVLYERILSALFIGLAESKVDSREKLLNNLTTSQTDRISAWHSCHEDIYKHIFDSIDHDYSIDENDLKKGLKIIKNISVTSKISFLNDFLQYAYSIVSLSNKKKKPLTPD